MNPKVLDGSDEFADPARHNPCVHQYVQIRGHPHRFDATLDGVDGHHLAPDERPLPRPKVSELKEGFPKGELITGQDRQLDRFPVEDRPAGHNCCSSWVAARRVRGRTQARISGYFKVYFELADENRTMTR